MANETLNGPVEQAMYLGDQMPGGIVYWSCWACGANYESPHDEDCAGVELAAAGATAAEVEVRALREALRVLIEHVEADADMLTRHHDTLARDVRLRLHLATEAATIALPPEPPEATDSTPPASG